MKRALFACVLAVSACQIDDADVPKFGGPCSNGCANGFRCDKDLDACVPEEEPTDAGFPDAGFPDAGNPELLTFTIETATQAAGASVSVELDEIFTLRWTTQDLTACSISSGVGNVNENGNVDLSLDAAGTTNYVLTCTGNGSPVSSAPVSAIVNTVIDGDLIVTTNEDLDAAIGITEITGNVVIDNASITGLTQLVTLTTIGGDFRYTNSESIDALDLPALTTIGGSLVVRGDEDLESVSANALTEIGDDLIVADLLALETLSLTSLTEIGRDFYLGTYEYPQFPNIADFNTCAGFLTPLPLPQLATVALPVLASIGRDFDSEDALALGNLSLPLLTEIGATFALFNLGENAAGPASFSAPLLANVHTVIIMSNDNLASIDLGGLTATARQPGAESPDIDAPIASNLASPLYQIYRAVSIDFCYGFGYYLDTGDLAIQFNGASDNDVIDNLDLSGLVTVAGMMTLDGTSVGDLEFTSLASISELVLGGGGATRNLSFPALTTIGEFGIDIDDQNAQLQSLSFPALASVTGGIRIGDVGAATTVTFPSLTTLTGAVSLNVGPSVTTFSLAATTLDELAIRNVPPAVLAGLGVETVTGEFQVTTEFVGTTLAGMEQLTTIGAEANFYAQNLVDFTGMEGLTTIGDYLNISGNIESTVGLESLEQVGSIDCTSDQLVSLSLPALTTIGGSSGFDSIEAVYSPFSQGSLESVVLPALTTVEDGVSFADTPLESINLGNVTTVRGLYIVRTALLDLNGLCNLTTIENELSIVSNASTPLADLSGLQNLTDIGDDIFLKSPAPALPLCQLVQIRDNTTPAQGIITTNANGDYIPFTPLPAPCALDTGACP